MKHSVIAMCALIAGLVCFGSAPRQAGAAVRSCAVIHSVRANLVKLQAVVSATPKISASQARDRTDKIKVRELAFELGTTRRVVPRDVDDSIAQVVSSIRHAVDLRTHHQMQQYQHMLTVIASDMTTAWNRFRAFQRDKRC